ncbi:Cytochrome P450 [Saccharopolyspora kobensis]|uniref:Cytochrome P450 n=1 Tax=Saccharopolyspora kobensis TaxID=146035 RepID=A0A1H6BN54_9PSEU|nr:cytochrome P450 [Saccharopolyspora kobensis]SEG62123.1 Cytochrome P450 [Saccharopolyspora kobensis]SFE85155.1 Cytochrome P450 [Saccharopolyspora kobensis]
MPLPNPYVLDPDATDVHGEATALRERGPATPVELPGRVTAWAVTDPDLLRRLLTDPRVSKDPRQHWPAWIAGEIPPDWPLVSWVAVENMFTAYGPEHRRLRSLVSGAFTMRRIAALRPEIESIVAELLDDLAADAGGPPVDLRERYAYSLPIDVICRLVGFPDDGSRAQLRRIVDTVFDTTAEPGVAAAGMLEAHQLFGELVEAKRREPGDDLASAMLAVRDENDSRLSEAELTGTIFLLLGAGHETTVNLLDHAITALLTHRDQLDRVLAGQNSWHDVIEETLRWQPPVSNLPLRYAVEDIKLDGLTIRRGEPILAAYAAAGRDPRHPEADRFDITRENKEHLSFGHGVHFCLGAPLARLEAEIALPGLFARFPDMSLAVPVTELRPMGSLMSNGHRELPVHLTP